MHKGFAGHHGQIQRAVQIGLTARDTLCNQSVVSHAAQNRSHHVAMQGLDQSGLRDCVANETIAALIAGAVCFLYRPLRQILDRNTAQTADLDMENLHMNQGDGGSGQQTLRWARTTMEEIHQMHQDSAGRYRCPKYPADDVSI